MKQVHNQKKKKRKIETTPPKYKDFFPSKYKSSHIYSPFLLRITIGNHQESESGRGGKDLLYLAKSALKATTSDIRSSNNCP